MELVPQTGPLIVPEGKARLRLTVVVPTYNEADNIEPLVMRMAAALSPCLADDYEIIVVDDGSQDGTAAVVRELARSCPHLKLLERETERGLATAVVRGWQLAAGETLGVLD